MSRLVTPGLYLLQTPLGYQLSPHPSSVGSDEEISEELQLPNPVYRQLLTQAGGICVYLDDEHQTWTPLTEQTPGKESLITSTYFKQRQQAEQAAQWLSPLI